MNIAELKKRVNPEAVFRHYLPNMKKADGDGWAAAPCPFHDERTPGAFHVNTLTGGYHCKSCGERGGDVVDFVSSVDGCTTKEAAKRLASEWGDSPSSPNASASARRLTAW